MNRKCCKRCNECEMLIEDHEIVINTITGLTSTTEIVPAVKCMKFGQSAFTLVELPESQIMDDIIIK